MKRKSTLIGTAGFALALALLGLVAWLNVRRSAQAQESAHWVAQTHQERYELRKLLSILQDVESGERAYVLVGTPDLLAPHEAGLRAVTIQLRVLRTLIADPEQKHALDVLEPLVASKIGHAERVVRLRRDVGFAAAQAQVATGEGQAAMDAVRMAIARMDEVEDGLLEERTAAAQREEDFVRRRFLNGSGLSIVLLIGVFALLLRENRLRQQSNLALQASEENLAVTLHSIGDAVLATDSEGRVTRLNLVAEQLTGWSQAEAVGRPAAEVFCVINEGTRQPAFVPIADTLAKGSIHGLANDAVLIARDGTERPIADSCAPIRNSEGRIIGVVLVFRDQTTQRKTQADVDRFFTLTPDMMGIADFTGHFRRVSPSFESTLGHASGTLLARPFMDFVHPDDRAATTAEMEKMSTGVPTLHFENRYSCADGSWKTVSWVAMPFLKEGLIYASGRDVSEQQRAAESLRRAHDELRSANTQLDQASRLKDEFLANMSHELRTPLNAILGLSEALLEQVSGTLNPRQSKAVATIASSGSHLLALINDILDLSKIEAGKLELYPERIELDEFCQSCLVFVRSQALQKSIAVLFERDPAADAISADPRRLKQILVNLLTNAVKFTPAGGRVGLRVAAPAGEARVQFTVWDSGIGIGPEDQTKLFKTFTQIDSGLSRSQEGTGLGLALVAQLVELHRGSVVVESELGRGSRFTVNLPLVAAPVAAAAEAAEGRRSYERALVIEDDPSAGEQLVRYLSELGVSSALHVRGDQAVEVALRERPDVILLDVLLPGESGWVVLTRLKDHPQIASVPVVVISIVDDRAKSLALGAVAHFTKPITRTQLAEFFQRSIDPPRPVEVMGESRRPGKGPVILLAEDNEANVLTIGGYLEDKGYTLRYAANGVEAVALARELRPAVILMDIQMPVMDGLTAITKIRAEAGLRDVPIVALTALAMPGDRERCLAGGATDYMTKPVSLKALAELIARLAPPRIAALS